MAWHKHQTISNEGSQMHDIEVYDMEIDKTEGGWLMTYFPFDKPEQALRLKVAHNLFCDDEITAQFQGAETEPFHDVYRFPEDPRNIVRAKVRLDESDLPLDWKAAFAALFQRWSELCDMIWFGETGHEGNSANLTTYA